MSAATTGVLAFLAAAALAFVLTPAAITLARRTAFMDQPAGYKQHAAATPYLGGLAVVTAFLVAFACLSDLRWLWPVAAGAGALCVVGTLDDRVGLGPGRRVAAEAVVALGLWDAGLGWHVFGSSLPDLALTVIWVVGIVNAFNLMDNLDGAATTVGMVSSAGVGALAIGHESAPLAGAAFALSGACAGFLPSNLASPARIFLGDGGSMPVGLLAAAVPMVAVSRLWHGDAMGLLAGAQFVGLVIFDTTLVVISRRRRHQPLLTGGRDHLTHRVLFWMGTPRRVAVALAAGQVALVALALASDSWGHGFLVCAAAVSVLGGVGAIVMLERRWNTPRAGLGPIPSRREPAISNETAAETL